MNPAKNPANKFVVNGRTFFEGEEVMLIKPYTAYGKAATDGARTRMKIGHTGTVQEIAYQTSDWTGKNMLAIQWHDVGGYYTDVDCISIVPPSPEEVTQAIESIKKAFNGRLQGW